MTENAELKFIEDKQRKEYVQAAAIVIYANDRTTFDPDPKVAICKAERIYEALKEKGYF
jgi:hypothetical protein